MKKWLRRILLGAGLLLVVLLGAGELTARYYLGLGDPPLSQADPTIEYLFQPHQDGHRFRNHYHYNAYSMRSDDFPEHKIDPHELRVLVVGDSVINGSNQTDQKDLATTLMQHDLAQRLHRPVVVGNISAGSWGPPNELAYLQKFGLFDADVVVLVLSSHDAYDVPTFEPRVGIDPSFPDHKPWSALYEGATRYLPGYLHHLFAAQAPPQSDPMGRQTPENEAACMQAAHDITDLVRTHPMKFLVALHLTQSELNGEVNHGYEVWRQECRDLHVEPILLAPLFSAARDQGPNPYRDDIHPNAIGQKIIAQALDDAIVDQVDME